MIRASGAALVVIAALWAWAVLAAPVDAMQGSIQKILYVHVPCAIGAYLGFLTTAVCGALYLRSSNERYDRAAIAAAEVGVVFCSLNIASGPIWARGTWTSLTCLSETPIAPSIIASVSAESRPLACACRSSSSNSSRFRGSPESAWPSRSSQERGAGAEPGVLWSSLI